MYLRIILLILLPIFGFSQAPHKINFQSILRNTNGEVVANKAVSLRISILSGSITGNTVYSETHDKTTDASGLISLQIGNGTVISGVFSAILWGNAAYFIKLEADFNGGSNYVLLGTQELMSVPYALYASKTDTSSLNLVNRFSSKVNLSDTSSMLNPYLRKFDSIIADLQLQNRQLQNLSTVVDIDGNSYKTVKIGSQVWMSENLKTSHYRNGGPIPNVMGNADWQALATGAWSNYNHDAANDVIYGKLYNWYTTIGDTLCPTGWGVPTDAEYTILITYLGGESVAQDKMKVTGTTYWESPNTGATNESDFSGLPGGYRDKDGSFSSIRNFAWFWSATEGNEYHRWLRFLFANNGSGNRGNGSANNYESVGASIRCLKGTEIDINQNLNLKVNIADTSDMLYPYLRKADAIIIGLQKQIEVLNSYTSLLASGLVDIDGNNYSVVKIGNQIWMKENLRVSRYRNGYSIPNITNNYEWSNLTSGAWNINQDVTIYGKLYNWFAVSDNRGLCPFGWHIPSNDEWITLTNFLGGESVAGAKLKATTLWYSNEGSTNESGFTAFANGFALINTANLHVDNGNLGIFWSSSDWSTWGAISRRLWSVSKDFVNYIGDRKNGFSVRCLRD